MKKPFSQKCRCCGLNWMTRKFRVVKCPKCQARDFDNPNVRINPITNYRYMMRKISSGESVKLAWLREYPDLPTLRSVATRKAKLKYNFWCSPSGLTVIRK